MVGEPPAGPAPESVDQPIAWVQAARRAAARDLLDLLGDLPQLDEIILVCPQPERLRTPQVTAVVTTPPGPIHVGRQLADLVVERKIERLLYFGGGAAPLLSEETLTTLAAEAAALERGVIANNRFATDWLALAPAALLVDWAERLPQDNMLGWVLSSEAGLPCRAYPPSAGSRLDIDTPVDLLTLRLHPGAQPHLRRLLRALPLDTTKIEQALEVLRTPASHIFISGRLGPEVWLALNRAARCWLRVLSEERGMISSGRQRQGQVYSFLARYLETAGLDAFFDELAEQADAAFIDTRVLLAHHRLWPSEADRFASDLGWAEQIGDPWLQTFTRYAQTAPLPIILGGHSLMAGDMLAFCEML